MSATAIPGECSKHGTDPQEGCFRCKTLGLSFAFPYGGREAFRGPTLGERQRKMMAEAKAQGQGLEPVGSRWV